MGNNEEGKSAKSEKPSSPVPPDQGNVHVYPDWAAMQAYYGPRVAMPPYYNSAVASGHAPHPYMWPPQPMMPPYGTPYAAIYSHGGVYAHPAVPLAVNPLNSETPSKSAGTADQGLMKKLKGFDGLAMSIGNGNAESAEGGDEHKLTQSEAEGSSNGSDGNTTKADQTGKKRSREETPAVGGGGKTETQSSSDAAREVNLASDKDTAGVVTAGGVSGNTTCPVLSPSMTTALELRNPSSLNAKTTSGTGPQPCTLPPETWLQNERELKRERRKQSNRESARRSRLRKQAETEELARKVESLTAENVALKSELNHLTEKAEKLRLENAEFLGKLKNTQLENKQETGLNNIDDLRVPPVNTENLLSRVNNPGSGDRNSGEESHMFEKKSNSGGAKLHQLLDTSPRADAVAAG